MNKFLKIFFVFAVAILMPSCAKDDDNKSEPIRDFATQYTADIASIDSYIDTHYMEVDADYNVTFTKIPTGGTQQSIRQQTTYPLDFTMVDNESQGVNYKIYFIKLREGNGRQPSEVDSVHVAYKGNLVDDFQFDMAQTPLWFQLQDVVPGWAEIIPKFKTGTYETTEGPNPIVYENYGAGVMFLPSALGYYANSSPSGTIAAYSPLIFSFKLMELRYKDHDRDGVLSKDEGDPANPSDKLIDYDQDEDGLANMNDIDDDGDNFLTRSEISFKYIASDGSKKTRLYPYNGAAADDPATPWDETRGIPRAFTGPLVPVIIKEGQAPVMLHSPGPGDFTDPDRLRRHVDPNAKPPFYDQNP